MTADTRGWRHLLFFTHCRRLHIPYALLRTVGITCHKKKKNKTSVWTEYTRTRDVEGSYEFTVQGVRR